jgi:hypothetical protein
MRSRGLLRFADTSQSFLTGQIVKVQRDRVKNAVKFRWSFRKLQPLLSQM